jgi:hypothetical protein
LALYVACSSGQIIRFQNVSLKPLIDLALSNPRAVIAATKTLPYEIYSMVSSKNVKKICKLQAEQAWLTLDGDNDLTLIGLDASSKKMYDIFKPEYEDSSNIGVGDFFVCNNSLVAISYGYKLQLLNLDSKSIIADIPVGRSDSVLSFQEVDFTLPFGFRSFLVILEASPSSSVASSEATTYRCYLLLSDSTLSSIFTVIDLSGYQSYSYNQSNKSSDQVVNMADLFRLPACLCLKRGNAIVAATLSQVASSCIKALLLTFTKNKDSLVLEVSGAGAITEKSMLYSMIGMIIAVCSKPTEDQRAVLPMLLDTVVRAIGYFRSASDVFVLLSALLSSSISIANEDVIKLVEYAMVSSTVSLLMIIIYNIM